MELKQSISTYKSENGDMNDVVKVMCKKGEGILNTMFQLDPSILIGPMKIIIQRVPGMISFKNKRGFFRQQMN